MSPTQLILILDVAVLTALAVIDLTLVARRTPLHLYPRTLVYAWLAAVAALALILAVRRFVG